VSVGKEVDKGGGEHCGGDFWVGGSSSLEMIARDEKEERKERSANGIWKVAVGRPRSSESFFVVLSPPPN